MVRKSNKTELTKTDQIRKEACADIRRKLCHVKSKQDKVNGALQQLQNFIETDGNVLSAKNKAKNITMYTNLLKSSESQTEYLRNILTEIQELRSSEYQAKINSGIKRRDLIELINQQGVTLPLWVNTNDSFPGEYVGAIAPPDGSKLCPGDAVAAYAKGNWFLAEVMTCLINNRYECRDVDDDGKKLAVFTRSKLIPLPKWRADPNYDKHALFPVDSVVLALYPQTTCFYKGVVDSIPRDATESYQIAFDDPSYPSGYSPPMAISQKYVVAYREIAEKRLKRLSDISDEEEEDDDDDE